MPSQKKLLGKCLASGIETKLLYHKSYKSKGKSVDCLKIQPQKVWGGLRSRNSNRFLFDDTTSKRKRDSQSSLESSVLYKKNGRILSTPSLFLHLFFHLCSHLRRYTLLSLIKVYLFNKSSIFIKLFMNPFFVHFEVCFTL